MIFQRFSDQDLERPQCEQDEIPDQHEHPVGSNVGNLRLERGTGIAQDSGLAVIYLPP